MVAIIAIHLQGSDRVTALKLIKTHKNIETIMENTSYSFPSDYTDVFHKAKENFLMFRDKINVDELVLVESKQDIDGLKDYLLNTVEMSESRVQNALKNFTIIINDIHR